MGKVIKFKLKPRAPLTQDRRTGGAHKVKTKTLDRKAKHKGRDRELWDLWGLKEA